MSIRYREYIGKKVEVTLSKDFRMNVSGIEATFDSFSGTVTSHDRTKVYMDGVVAKTDLSLVGPFRADFPKEYVKSLDLAVSSKTIDI